MGKRRWTPTGCGPKDMQYNTMLYSMAKKKPQPAIGCVYSMAKRKPQPATGCVYSMAKRKPQPATGCLYSMAKRKPKATELNP